MLNILNSNLFLSFITKIIACNTRLYEANRIESRNYAYLGSTRIKYCTNLPAALLKNNKRPS